MNSVPNVAHMDDDELFRAFVGQDDLFVAKKPSLKLSHYSSASTKMIASDRGMSDKTLDKSVHMPIRNTSSELFKHLHYGSTTASSKTSELLDSAVVKPLEQASNVTSSLGEMPGSSSFSACPEHRERSLDVFCNVCNVPICTSCAIFGKHQGHRFTQLEQAYKACSAEIRAHLNRLEHQVTSMRAFLAEIGSVRMQLNSSAESCAEQIRNNIQFLKVSLDQKMNALLKEVAEAKQVRLDALDTQAQAVREDISNFEKLSVLAQNMLETSSSAQYLKKHKFLAEQIANASENTLNMQPCVEPDLPLKLSVSLQTKAINDICLKGPANTTFGLRNVETYTSDLDRNGIMFRLGTVASGSDEFISPVSSGLVEVICPEWGYADHIDRTCWQENPSSVFTGGKFGAWICFKLAGGYKATPTRYRIQHAGDCPTHVLRNWVFEGSHDGETWDVMSIHNNDTSLGEAEGSHASWEIAPASVKRPYNYFRLRITGPNSSNGHHLMVGSIELWGALVKE